MQTLSSVTVFESHLSATLSLSPKISEYAYPHKIWDVVRG